MSEGKGRFSSDVVLNLSLGLITKKEQNTLITNPARHPEYAEIGVVTVKTDFLVMKEALATAMVVFAAPNRRLLFWPAPIPKRHNEYNPMALVLAVPNPMHPKYFQ